MAKTIYDFKAEDITGKERSLNEFKNQVLLIVNTASKCGFTPQYSKLEELYQQYKDRGFTVLAFPCNQFGQQEPGQAQDIKEFCDLKFNINFPLFNKVDVNGDQAHPLYQFLKSAKPGVLGSKKIKWNFTKFLIDKNGQPIERYAPQTGPEKIAPDIEKLL